MRFLAKGCCLISLLLSLTTCAYLRKLPKEHYYPFYYRFRQAYRHDTIYLHVKNPLMCPMNVRMADDSLGRQLSGEFGLIRLREKQDTILPIYWPGVDSVLVKKIKYVLSYGSAGKTIVKAPVSYPFPAGRRYKIIQGYNGKFSHNTPQSRYSIDFKLGLGDTITCVDNGFVVGLIDGYKEHGTSKAWRNTDRSNYIVIYHPYSGLYSQYVHLAYQGSLVKLGEPVGKGQPIGICGMTGYTTTPHLHFSMKYPTEHDDLVSTAIGFKNNIGLNHAKKNNPVTDKLATDSAGRRAPRVRRQRLD